MLPITSLPFIQLHESPGSISFLGCQGDGVLDLLPSTVPDLADDLLEELYEVSNNSRDSDPSNSSSSGVCNAGKILTLLLAAVCQAVLR